MFPFFIPHINTGPSNTATSFPGGSVVRNPPANAEDPGDVGSVARLGRSPGAENGNLL